jgi:hypothetical protein
MDSFRDTQTMISMQADNLPNRSGELGTIGVKWIVDILERHENQKQKQPRSSPVQH